MRTISRFIAIALLSTDFIAAQAQVPRGIDTGLDAIQAAAAAPEFPPTGPEGRWLRLRNVDLKRIDETRAALLSLRQQGFHTCVMMRIRGVPNWHLKYLPTDLFTTYELHRQLGAAFGDLVDAWEIDNEPDIGFVPENAERYAAFLKAAYWGIKAGSYELGAISQTGAGSQKVAISREPGAVSLNGATSDELEAVSQAKNTASEDPKAKSSNPTVDRPPPTAPRPPPTVDHPPSTALRPPSTVHRERPPFVLMAPLALPPGPWLEQFAANDGFSYTDGYNYHYYGYAEDFTAVYHQHQSAFTELTTARQVSRPLRRQGDRSWAASTPHQEGFPATAKAGRPALGGEHAASGRFASPSPHEVLRQVSGFSDTSQVSPSSPPPPAPSSQLIAKSYPLFLTETGYGMLGKGTRDTKDGRLRQWRWFQSVGRQADDLRIAAPMGFYLPPYLENDANEFGVTVPPPPESVATTPANASITSWQAGAHVYTPDDFDAPKTPGWQNWIGRSVKGNQLTPAGAWWLAAPPTPTDSPSTVSWTATTPEPSPVVLDFLPGPGLLTVKRYNAHFVTKKPSTAHRPPPTESPPTANRPPSTGNRPPSPDRTEALTVNIRTRNGNLYYVNPQLSAKPAWQHYLEPADNHTMAFYGRAEPSWRFKDNQPASLVLVLYPKKLPAVYEFMLPQLVRIGAEKPSQAALEQPPDQPSPANTRTGQGQLVLYNFSNTPITGDLILPPHVQLATASPPSSQPLPPITPTPLTPTPLTLAPQERRVLDLTITVPAGRYERFPAEFIFQPTSQPPIGEETSTPTTAKAGRPALGDEHTTSESTLLTAYSSPLTQSPSPLTAHRSLPPSVLRTDFIPDIAGLPGTSLTHLFMDPLANYAENTEFVRTRPRVTEEIPMQGPTPLFAEPNSTAEITPNTPTVFTQPGAEVTPTLLGFTVTITSLPPGKEQRIEVELPLPDGLEFPKDAFLSLQYRLQQE